MSPAAAAQERNPSNPSNPIWESLTQPGMHVDSTPCTAPHRTATQNSALTCAVLGRYIHTPLPPAPQVLYSTPPLFHHHYHHHHHSHLPLGPSSSLCHPPLHPFHLSFSPSAKGKFLQPAYMLPSMHDAPPCRQAW
ncbi:uncharacterized protein TrAtP1_008906 [Trichoderma atroviride]|uniref:uncharacterized protein n=1 Tax=Hypocrea atroviridis TaxID=63577 RepID=UPI00331753AE|nr:hypothetical protein TrAtP1_008906 [Trichoderma atroviride]